MILLNRRRYEIAEARLRAIRKRVFEWDADAKKAAQAQRIISELKERLKPFWDEDAHNRRVLREMHQVEPGWR